MTYEKTMAEKNLITKITVGSALYGTNTKTSDTDYFGIFIPELSYIFGLRQCNTVNLGIINKLKSGKNDINAVDFICYALPFYMNLLYENAVNVIEPLFAPEKNIKITSDIWNRLIENKNKFISKKIISKIYGYASSQEHKMKIKLENYNALLFAKNFLENNLQNKFLFELKIPTNTKFIKIIQDKSNIKWIVIGDLKFMLNRTTKKTLKDINTRLNKIGNRKELILKHGYDTKFSMHYLRLLLEGIELLNTGTLVFPLANKEFLLDVRNGKYSLDDIFYFGNILKTTFRKLESKSNLPNIPDFNFINTLLIDIVKTYWNFK